MERVTPQFHEIARVGVADIPSSTVIPLIRHPILVFLRIEGMGNIDSTTSANFEGLYSILDQRGLQILVQPKTVFGLEFPSKIGSLLKGRSQKAHFRETGTKRPTPAGLEPAPTKWSR